jgi:cytosolic iron-sulfur protein assembly protein CIAO1
VLIGWRAYGPASVSDDRTLRTWQRTREADADAMRDGPWACVDIVPPTVHTRTIYSVAWSAAGLIATGAGDNAIRLFAAAPSDGSAPTQLVAVAAQAHEADVNCVRWCPTDPTLLASAGDDRVVRLWRVVG